ncbi:MADS box transcription factor [Pseudozyma hubeiensis SY62]|uniref:MADS box transcription factor n=1 Tax=Pseudozyma hubeiensis (strain SY62) TaxID=1305764 RepID=R9NWZ3_PSEHS|nr:MADS box transcription factor [Pseudozyma hubeiensis SY62]GAC93153.1 MADS box transcription factor [Pseudozyma hubeiensis SY62]
MDFRNVTGGNRDQVPFGSALSVSLRLSLPRLGRVERSVDSSPTVSPEPVCGLKLKTNFDCTGEAEGRRSSSRACLPTPRKAHGLKQEKAECRFDGEQPASRKVRLWDVRANCVPSDSYRGGEHKEPQQGFRSSEARFLGETNFTVTMERAAVAFEMLVRAGLTTDTHFQKN